MPPAIVVAGIALFVSCGSDTGSTITGPEQSGSTPPPASGGTPPAGGGTATGSVSGISVTPSTTTIAVGDSVKLAATLQTTGAPPAGGWSIGWQSSDTAIVTISAVGVATARAAGVAGISASAGGVSSAAVVTVQPQPWVTSVALSPPAATMIVGDTLAFSTAIGSVGAIPAGGWPVSWLADPASVATVSRTGIVTAIAPGLAQVTASAGTRAAIAPIRVFAGPTVTGILLSPGTLYLGPGEQGTLITSLTTVGTMPAGGWPITWSSASTSIATVDSTGRVTAVAPGSTTISATSSGETGYATVAVSTPSGGTTSVVTAVTISPSIKVWMVTGGTKTLTASVSANGPPPQSGWSIGWTTSDAAVVTVSASGLMTAVAPGIATITATVNGVAGTLSVEVLPPPGVIDLRISSSEDPIYVAQSDSVALDVTYTLVGPLPPGGFIVTWSSSNPAVATVSASGVVKGVTLGSAVITATAYGKTSSVNFVVVAPQPPPPPPTVSGITSLSILPAVMVLAPGGRGWARADVTATTAPPGGPGGPNDWPVVWASSDRSVVDMPGINTAYVNYDALAEGVTTISASLGGKTATSMVYVATPTSITLSPTAASLAVGAQTTVTATVTSSGPLPASGYPVAYSSSSPLVASVSETGVVTALGAGKTRIMAFAGTLQAVPSVVTVSGPGLSLSLTGTTTVKGSIAPFDANSYYLGCDFPMTMTASGSGTARWGNEEWSINGGPFKSFPPMTSQTLAAGSSMVWRVYTGEGIAPTPAEVTGYTATVRTHYAVNAGYQDYPNGIAQDYSITTTYTCQR